MKNLNELLKSHIEYLSIDCYSRHCGSESEKKAADYIENYFRSLGLSVRREYYPVRGWRFGNFRLENLTKNRTVRDIVPCFFSAGVDVTGVPLIIETADPSAYSKLDVVGRICFIKDPSGFVFEKNAAAEELERLGAAAVIFISTGTYAPSTKIVRSPYISRIACASVGCIGTNDILYNRDDTYRFYMDAEPFDTESCNVIATLGEGTAKGVFGAHYDTAPCLAGAGDNASGTAMLLECARLLRDTNPGMTVEFAAFSAEEYIPKCIVDGTYNIEGFPPGSGNYVDKHRSEDIRWYINLDDYGILTGTPYFALGNAEKLPSLNYRYPTKPTGYPSDDKSFGYAGIPTIFLSENMIFRNLHTPLDTIDKLDIPKIGEGVLTITDIYDQLIAANRA